jgi:hypothetical protein
MRLSIGKAILTTVSLAAYGQQVIPRMITATSNGKKGDVISVSGENLQKESVAKVLLTDGRNDFSVDIAEQTSTTLRFKIPDRAGPGRMAFMILTTGRNGKYVSLLRFKITIDQSGNFQIDDSYKRKAADRAQAVQWIEEQNDTVMGKGQRTLALIRDVTTWYEVDSTNPKATTAAEQLRDFYASFGEEYHKLQLIHEANEKILTSEDILLLQEATKASQEITSKMRRLTAMGFQ